MIIESNTELKQYKAKFITEDGTMSLNVFGGSIEEVINALKHIVGVEPEKVEEVDYGSSRKSD